MPSITIVENGAGPSPRTQLQIASLRGAGWRVVVVGRGESGEGALGCADSIEQVSVSADTFHPFSTVRRQMVLEHGSASSHAAVAKAAGQSPTPLGVPYPFGVDPIRLERFWYAAASAAADRPCDLIQASDLDALPAVVWAADAARQRPAVVFDSHELYPELTYVPEVFREAWRELARRFVVRCDLSIAVSAQMAEKLSQWYGATRTCVIHNVPPTTESSTGDVRSRLGLGRDQPLAVHVGAIAPNRRIDQVVALLVRIPSLHIVLVGIEADSERYQQLAGVAAGEGVATRLHAVEAQPREELVAFLRSADVSLITYPPEGEHLRVTLPNKLFDSLAAGLPIVAAAGTAAVSFARSLGVGVEFRAFELDEFADRVQQVLDSPTLTTAARRMAGRFRWEDEGCRYLEALSELLRPNDS